MTNSVPDILKSNQLYITVVLDHPWCCSPELFYLPLMFLHHTVGPTFLLSIIHQHGREKESWDFYSLQTQLQGLPSSWEEWLLSLTPKALYPSTVRLFALQVQSPPDTIFYSEGLASFFVSHSGSPQRVNGKVKGRIFVGASQVPIVFENTDLHSYVVMNHGRSYTAISTIPETVGYSLLPLAPIGGIIGWMFAVEQDGFKNGFSITGNWP